MYTTPNCNTVITTKQHIKIFLDQQPAFITTITMAVGKMQNCGMCKVKCGMKTVKCAVERWVKCVMRKFAVCGQSYIHGKEQLIPMIMNGRVLYVSCYV